MERTVWFQLSEEFKGLESGAKIHAWGVDCHHYVQVVVKYSSALKCFQEPWAREDHCNITETGRDIEPIVVWDFLKL